MELMHDLAFIRELGELIKIPDSGLSAVFKNLFLKAQALALLQVLC